MHIAIAAATICVVCNLITIEQPIHRITEYWRDRCVCIQRAKEYVIAWLQELLCLICNNEQLIYFVHFYRIAKAEYVTHICGKRTVSIMSKLSTI